MVVRASRKRQLLVALGIMYMFGVQWVDYMSNSLTVGSHPEIVQWITLMGLGVPVLYLVRATLENLIKKEPVSWKITLSVMAVGALSLMMEGWVSDGLVMLATTGIAAALVFGSVEHLRPDRQENTVDAPDYELDTPEGYELY